MDRDVLRQGVFLALQQPVNVLDPYPFYHRLRSESPFHWDFVLSTWFLTRYADVEKALSDPRLSTQNFAFDVTQLPPDLQEGLAPLGRLRKREALYNDATEHERLRRPLNRAFNPACFERIRPGLEWRTNDLLAQAVGKPETDLVEEYAKPLGDDIMSELLGIPKADRRQFIEWCDELKELAVAPRMGDETVVKARRAVKSLEALQQYVGAMIAERRKNLKDDLIGHYLAVETSEVTPTQDEIVANAVLFLHAAVGNAAAAIVNGIVTLVRHPDEFAKLRAAPQSLGVAIEELLRYDTPLHVAIRGVKEEMEFQGRRIGPNHLLVLLLGAANRDPEQFPDPDRLDLARRPNRHLAFGAGPHGCVGAWLARFGMAIALKPFLEQGTTLRLVSTKLQWKFPAIRRTVRALPVIVRANTRSSGRKRSLEVVPSSAE